MALRRFLHLESTGGGAANYATSTDTDELRLTKISLVDGVGGVSVDAGNARITGVADPTDPSDATSKSFVEGLLTSSAILALIEAADGSGSGLDADLLDGHDSAYFQTALGYTPVNKAGDTGIGSLVSNVASGSNAITLESGARLLFDGVGGTRYLSWNGATLGFNGNISVGVGVVNAGQVYPAATSFLSLWGRITDGASAIGVKIGNVNALSTSGAKIVSLYSDQGTTEKAYVDKDGLGFFGSLKLLNAPQALTADATYSLLTSGLIRASGGVHAGAVCYATTFTNTNAGSTTGNVHSPYYTADATSIGHYFNTGMSTGVVLQGAKLASWRAYSVEKLYFDKDGAIGRGNGVVLRSDQAAAGVSVTNLCLQSQTFDSATWTKSGSVAAAPTITPNSVAAPDGTTTADTIAIPTVSAGYSAIGQTVSLASTTAYTYSVWLRASAPGSTYLYVYSGGFRAAVLFSVTTEWRRYHLVFTTTSAGNYAFYIGVDVATSGTTMVGQSAVTLYAWGAQIEAGTVPTNYLPTTTSTVAAVYGEAGQTTTTTQLTAGKLYSWKNVDIEKAYIDKDGSFYVGNNNLGLNGLNANNVAGNTVTMSSAGYFGVSSAATEARLKGNATDGSSAIAVKIGNVNALSTAGAKICSFYSDNLSTEKSYFDKDGYLSVGGKFTAEGSGLSGAGSLTLLAGNNGLHVPAFRLGLDGLRFDFMRFYYGSTPTNVLTGESANSHRYMFIGHPAGGNEILSASITHLGFEASTIIGRTATAAPTISAILPSSLTLKGSLADASNAVGVVVDTTSTYSTSGAKLLSIRNNTSEKASVDKDGIIAAAGANLSVADATGIGKILSITNTSSSLDPVFGIGIGVGGVYDNYIKFFVNSTWVGGFYDGATPNFIAQYGVSVNNYGRYSAFNHGNSYWQPDKDATSVARLQGWKGLEIFSFPDEGTVPVTNPITSITLGQIYGNTAQGSKIVSFRNGAAYEMTYVDKEGNLGAPVTLRLRSDTPAAGRTVTNYCLHSQDFGNAAWVRSGTGAAAPTVTTDTIVAPDGSTTADVISIPAVSAGQLSTIAQTITTGNGYYYAFSIWLKAVAPGTTYLYLHSSSFRRIVALSVTTTWQRFHIQGTTATTSLTFGIGADTVTSGTIMTAQSAITLHAWGAQVEYSVSQIGPYVPTTTASAAVTVNEAAVTTTQNLLSTGKLHTWKNADVEKAYVTKDGEFINSVQLWDDVQGPITQAGGAATLTYEAYRDTTFFTYFMRHNQDDTLYLTYQLPHTWDPTTSVNPHMHVIPMVDPTSSPEVVRITGKYAWTQFGVELPADASWTSFTVDTNIVTGDAFKEKIISLATIAPPSTPKESAVLCIWIRRPGSSDAADTYSTSKATGTASANLCVLSIDAHFRKHKRGTITEYT